MYVFIASFSILWIVVVLIDGQYGLGAPRGITITASRDPFMYWASIVFFSVLLIGMIALLIRGELDFRKLKASYEQIVKEKKKKK